MSCRCIRPPDNLANTAPRSNRHDLVVPRHAVVEEVDAVDLGQKRQNVLRSNAVALNLPRILVLCRGVARNEHVFIVSLLKLIQQHLLLVVVPGDRRVSQVLETRMKRMALRESKWNPLVPLKPHRRPTSRKFNKTRPGAPVRSSPASATFGSVGDQRATSGAAAQSAGSRV